MVHFQNPSKMMNYYEDIIVVFVFVVVIVK